MADDFGNFTGFSTDFPANDNPIGVSNHHSNDLKWPSTSNQGSFPDLDISGNGHTNFTIGGLTEDTSAAQVDGFSNFAQFDMNMADIDIPLPTSPTGVNVHVAGGVPFEIPPLPDSCSFDDFSPIIEKENPIDLVGTHLEAIPDPIPPSRDNDTIQHTASQSVEVSSHSSPTTFTLDVNTIHSKVGPNVLDDSKKRSEHFLASTGETTATADWSADFGSFEVPPPIEDLPLDEEFSTPSETKNTNKSEVSNIPLVTESKTEDTGIGMANESRQNGEKSLPVSHVEETKTDAFGDFGTFQHGSSDFASFNSKPEADDTITQGMSELQERSIKTSSTVSNYQETKEEDFGEFSTSKASSDDIPSFAAFKDVTPAGSFDAFANSGDKPQSDGFGAFTNSGDKAQSDGFGAFTNSGDTAQSTKDGSFGVFTTEKTPINSPEDDFGGFASSQTVDSFVTSEEKEKTTKDDFGKFSGGDNFGAFGRSEVVPSDDSAQDDFGNFSGGGEFGNTNNTNPAKDDFGNFSSVQSGLEGGGGFGAFESSSGPTDDFGDFTSSDKDTSGFGDFSSSAIQSQPPLTLGVGQARQDMSKCLLSWFPTTGELSENLPSYSKLQSLLLISKSVGFANQSAWQSLQQCVDFTIPLYKWDKSTLQDQYYSAIKVDPMLISRPDTLAILTGMTKFEDPLGGTTAAEDLMESFGFVGELEQSSRRSVSPPPGPNTRGVRQRSEERQSTPKLLDLSLPETPGSPTGKSSFTLTEDLLGLDLNPQPQGQQLTSIQELLRNERLVVNKSKWVDSKLVELGDGENEGGETGSQPSTPQSAKRQNTVEFQLLQLGLDANKVSSFTGGNKELSLAARSVLGRLPDLSFMLTTDSVVKSTQYSV